MNPSNRSALHSGSFTRRTLMAAGATMLLAANAVAQGEWPAGRALTWVVPYPAGGSTDVLGRNIAQRVAASLGATIVVDNKAGATGTIGSAFVAKSTPDGYTLLGTSIGPQAIAPHLMAKLPYEPLRDLEPVIMVGTIPHILVVAANQPYKSVAELLQAAKAQPGKLAYASGGNGTILHMQGELLKQRNGADFIHVPYKGDTPALQDTLGGMTHFMFAPAAAALPHVQSGRLRALAVTSAARLKALPQVPTMAEAGQDGFVVEQWQAVYLPARTPAPVVQRLNQEIGKALKDPVMVELADKLGVTLVGGTPQHLAQTQQADSVRWAKVIQQGNIKAE